MTSNIGSREILESMNGGGDEAERYKKLQSQVKRELGKEYRPEFLNRLDEIIVFRPLEKTEVSSIADLMLQSVCKRALDKGITLEFKPEFKGLLYANGFSPRFGARPMRRCVRGMLENNLAECMLDGFASSGDTVSFTYDQESDLIAVATSSDGSTRTFPVEFASGIEDASPEDEFPAFVGDDDDSVAPPAQAFA